MKVWKFSVSVNSKIFYYLFLFLASSLSNDSYVGYGSYEGHKKYDPYKEEEEEEDDVSFELATFTYDINQVVKDGAKDVEENQFF